MDSTKRNIILVFLVVSVTYLYPLLYTSFSALQYPSLNNVCNGLALVNPFADCFIYFVMFQHGRKITSRLFTLAQGIVELLYISYKNTYFTLMQNKAMIGGLFGVSSKNHISKKEVKALLSRRTKEFGYTFGECTLLNPTRLNSNSVLPTVISGGMRTGKSISILLPTVLQAAYAELNNNDGPDLVIHDPDGQIERMSKAALISAGYTVQSLDYNNIMASSTFNPLAYLTASRSAAQNLAGALVSMNQNTTGDSYWRNESQKLIASVIYIVIKLFRKGEGKYENLIIGSKEFQGDNLSTVFRIISLCTTKKNRKSLIEQLLGVLSEEELQDFDSQFVGIAEESTSNNFGSFISQSIQCLSPWADADTILLTSSNTLDLKNLQNKNSKQAIFVRTKTKDQHFITIINLLFNQILSNSQNEEHFGQKRQLQILIDEAGSLSLYNLEKYMSNLRKYNVGLMMLFQNTETQLRHTYGATKGSLINSLFSHRLYFGGSDTNSNRELSALIGDHEIMKYPKLKTTEVGGSHEFRTGEIGKAWAIFFQQKPIELKLKTAEKVRRFKKLLELKVSDDEKTDVPVGKVNLKAIFDSNSNIDRVFTGEVLDYSKPIN